MRNAHTARLMSLLDAPMADRSGDHAVTPAHDRPQGTLTPMLWAGAEQWAHHLFSFAVMAVLARLLEPAAFGVVALASLCLSLFTILIGQGVGTAIVRLRVAESKHLSSSFWVAMGISILLLAVSVVAAPAVSRWIGATEMTTVLRALAFLLPIGALTAVPMAILTRDLRFDTLAKRAVVGIVVGGVVAIIAAVLGWGVWSLVIQQILSALVGGIFLWGAVAWRPSSEISAQHLKDVAGVALVVVANAVTWLICQRADQAIIGAGIGPYDLALYAMATKLLMLLAELVRAPFTRVALPLLSQHQDDRLAFEATYVRLTTGAVLIGLPSMIGVALVAPDAVAVVLGHDWHRSASVIRLLLGYGVVHILFGLFDSAMFAKGQTTLYVPLMLLNAATSIVASLIGLQWGLEGIAIAATAKTILHGIIDSVVLQRFLRVRISVVAAAIAPIVTSSACMAGAVWLLRMTALEELPPWSSLLASMTIGTLVYSGVLYLLAPLLTTDISKVLGQVAGRLSSRLLQHRS